MTLCACARAGPLFLVKDPDAEDCDAQRIRVNRDELVDKSHALIEFQKDREKSDDHPVNQAPEPVRVLAAHNQIHGTVMAISTPSCPLPVNIL